MKFFLVENKIERDTMNDWKHSKVSAGATKKHRHSFEYDSTWQRCRCQWPQLGVARGHFILFFQKMNQMEQSLTPAATLPPTHPPASNYGASEGGGRSLNPPPPSSPY